MANTQAANTAQGSQFYTDALAAFGKQEYADAARLAEHAAVDMPQNPLVHQLLSQSLLALGDYRGAAIEAHVAVATNNGKVMNWPELYRLYGNVGIYTDQLRALEKYAGQNPKAADARFLLGYQYLIIGHPNSARRELAQAVKLTPEDKLAQQLLKQLGGPPAAQVASPPRPAAGAKPKG